MILIVCLSSALFHSACLGLAKQNSPEALPTSSWVTTLVLTLGKEVTDKDPTTKNSLSVHRKYGGGGWGWLIFSLSRGPWVRFLNTVDPYFS